jgi:SAM-dependent methyltransferase
MHPRHFPAPTAERDRYLLHHNELGDEKYTKYMKALIEPLIVRIPKGAKGLDYGCGPACVVETELKRAGFQVNSFDPFFRNQLEYLDEQYEFIFCCETAEHLHNPLQEFSRFQRVLKAGGLLLVVTELFSDSQLFDDWWYTRDFTHVCFYSESTMQWIAGKYDWRFELMEGNVALFQKASQL